MTAVATPETGAAAARPRGTTFQRVRATTLIAGAGLIERLPEDVVLRTADLGGRVGFRVAGGRRVQARRNLARVARWAAETGASTPAVRAAADDPAALDGLVESAFRQHGRYWAELVRAPRMTGDYIRERVDMSGARVLDDAVAIDGPVIFIGLHFGAVELPAYYLAQVAGRTSVGAMETVSDPELAHWFLETRGAMGIRLVGLREARREMLAAARQGSALALVADRDLTGGGIATPFFGHPAPLPAGPALLALETGAPIFAIAVRRIRTGRYAARVEEVPVPSEGSRRERVERTLVATARLFESYIADAPAQWWGAFYPVWPDLEEAAA